MKNILLVFVCFVFVSCSDSVDLSGPFDYELVKSKLNLSESKEADFNQVVGAHLKQIKAVFQSGEGTQEEKLVKAKSISALQDEAVSKILSEDQFVIYKHEIEIERKGREQHNMQLILRDLNLDSLQTVKFNKANEAFYKTLVDNHDYYHGQPKVFRQYYDEIDVSRKQLFQSFMTDDQWLRYTQLVEKFQIGKSEH